MIKKFTGIKCIEGKRYMTFTDGINEYLSEITAKISRVFKSDNRELKEFYIKKHVEKAVEHDLVIA